MILQRDSYSLQDPTSGKFKPLTSKGCQAYKHYKTLPFALFDFEFYCMIECYSTKKALKKVHKKVTYE